MKQKSLSLLFAGIVFGVFSPLWLGYLSTPERLWPTWDPGSHYNDGLILYHQLIRFDLISFLYQLIHFSFWLPTHPLLVCLSQFFSPNSIDAAVFINFLIISAGFAWIVDIYKRDVLVIVFLIAVSLGLQQSTPWVLDMNRVMLEPLCLVLTMLVIICMALGKNVLASSLYFALLMTKVHYGIYLLPGLLIGSDVWKVRKEIFKSSYSYLKTKQALFLGVLLMIGIGILAFRVLNGPWSGTLFGRQISFTHYHHVLWFVLFVGLIGCFSIYLGLRKTLKNKSPEFYSLMTYALLPFLFYYLMPIKHKVKAFLENAAYTPSQEMSHGLMDYLHFYRVIREEYLGSNLSALLLIILVGSSILITIQKKWSRSLFAPIIHVMTFTLLMGRVALFKEARFGVPLLAIFLAWVLVWLMVSIKANRRLGYVPLVGYLIFSFLQITHWPKVNDLALQTKKGYLAVNNHEWSTVLPQIDFNQTTIVWGLGVDHFAPKLVSEFLMRVPSFSNLVHKPEYYINDLGYEGMRAPREFIQSKWNSKSVNQLLFYLPDFESNAKEWKGLADSRIIFESRYWLLLRRG